MALVASEGANFLIYAREINHIFAVTEARSECEALFGNGVDSCCVWLGEGGPKLTGFL